jgi:hypothetical protein
MIPYKGDRFTVLMPGKPVKSSHRVPSAAGPVDITILLVRKAAVPSTSHTPTSRQERRST